MRIICVSLCRLLFWPSLVLVNTLGTPTAVHATVAIPAPSGGGGGGALPTEARLLFGPAYRTVALRPARTAAAAGEGGVDEAVRA